MRNFIVLTAVLAILAGSAALIAPHAEHALALRLAADRPERIADLRLARAFDADTARREVAAALAIDDVELATSFAELAKARGLRLPANLLARLEAAHSPRQKVRRAASRFGRGLVTGVPEGVEGLAGAATGDLFVFGDVRDLVREGWRSWRGQPADRLMVGLAAAGLAVTAGTYFVVGAGAPARAGLSLFKAARRSGKIGVNFAVDVGRVARKGGGARAVNAFVDLARIEGKAGARTAIEGLRYADNVGDVAKVSRLAGKNGRATLAILKTLGRGALVLGTGALAGAFWVMGAAANIFLLVVTLCTIFAMLVRWTWRSGRLAWRGGRFAVTKVAVGTS